MRNGGAAVCRCQPGYNHLPGQSTIDGCPTRYLNNKQTATYIVNCKQTLKKCKQFFFVSGKVQVSLMPHLPEGLQVALIRFDFNLKDQEAQKH